MMHDDSSTCVGWPLNSDRRHVNDQRRYFTSARRKTAKKPLDGAHFIINSCHVDSRQCRYCRLSRRRRRTLRRSAAVRAHRQVVDCSLPDGCSIPHKSITPHQWTPSYQSMTSRLLISDIRLSNAAEDKTLDNDKGCCTDENLVFGYAVDRRGTSINLWRQKQFYNCLSRRYHRDSGTFDD